MQHTGSVARSKIIMAPARMSLFAIIYIVSAGLVLLVHCRRHDDEDEEKKKMSCTYFDPRRFPKPQHGLVNCSWYAPNACCKRTEVTSVFSNMYPLYGASKACRNRMNYLMCYFCSPEQGIWYHGKMSVCEEYCIDIYNECRLASYEGVSIGSVYGNGTAFCNAQNFDVVEGTHNCFEFDPLPFAAAISLTSTSVILYTCVCLFIFLR